MHSRQKIGILGATGMVGQRFIQLLEHHPWFEVAWLAASDRSSGKPYGEAVRWKLDTPLPDNIAAMPVSPAVPEGAPKVIFAALDADIARDMEPRFAAAGCAVISNSSAFRMQADVPLVVPEVNADHLRLIEEQAWRKQSGGYIVTNPNCSAIGLVLALKPIEERFGIESIFVTTMQAVSGAGYPGVPSLDILGNVVPFIKTKKKNSKKKPASYSANFMVRASRISMRRSVPAATALLSKTATPNRSPSSCAPGPRASRCCRRGTTLLRSKGSSCRLHPGIRSNSYSPTTVRNRDSIACAVQVWQQP